ncbi:MAG: pantetheine-phosphate adenylyltransferase [Chloroflexota bacterium]
MRIAIYPGTFDPFHNGHLDITQRASRLFDELIVAVYEHPEKNALFSAAERLEIARKACESIPNVQVESFSGLAVEYSRVKKASALVRGLRAISDFEFEFEIAHMNRKLYPEVEATFLMTSLPYSFLRSSIVKEIAKLGGSLEGLVPRHVEEALRRKYEARARAGGLPTSSLVP